MIRIKLWHGEWIYDPDKPLGPKGGFGIVFAGTAIGQKEPLAVKRLNITAKDSAHRELRIAEELANRQFAHIIPILDAGLDAESGFYFVVMAKAEKSLQDELKRRMTFVESETVDILLQVATGLSEVPEIVHRDLKPANVLYHGGKWKIADFGIARFVEESTSLQTLKACLSPQYAAPEQWKYERATSTTDIYALGCIGYTLLTGQFPFQGPELEDFMQQHLHRSPPKLSEMHSPQLRSLLSMMLRKLPETRPNINRVKDLLSEIASNTESADLPAEGFDAIAQAGASAAERDVERQAQQNLEKSKREKREQIAVEARRILEDDVIKVFIKKLRDRAPSTQVDSKRGGIWQILLGEAKLEINIHRTYPENVFNRSGWDVIVGATIQVIQNRPEYVWGASLWYTDLGSGEEMYRWWEVSYFLSPLLPDPLKRPSDCRYDPYALANPHAADAAAAKSGVHQIASAPYPIDDENVDDFCNRWAEILAKACQGQLEPPRYLPLD